MLTTTVAQVATALSEDVRDRIGIVALRRHLQKLQREVSAAHQRLHATQVCTAWSPSAARLNLGLTADPGQPALCNAQLP